MVLILQIMASFILKQMIKQGIAINKSGPHGYMHSVLEFLIRSTCLLLCLVLKNQNIDIQDPNLGFQIVVCTPMGNFTVAAYIFLSQSVDRTGALFEAY